MLGEVLDAGGAETSADRAHREEEERGAGRAREAAEEHLIEVEHRSAAACALEPALQRVADHDGAEEREDQIDGDQRPEREVERFGRASAAR